MKSRVYGALYTSTGNHPIVAKLCPTERHSALRVSSTASSSITSTNAPSMFKPSMATPLATQLHHATPLRTRSHHRSAAKLTVHRSQNCMYIFASRE